MSKFNTAQVKAIGRSIIGTSTVSTGTTHQGGLGFGRDPKSELFLLGVTNFVNEKTFYESGKARDERFATLVRTVAAQDMDWLRDFGIWLRTTGNMRTAALVVGAEAYRAGVPVLSELVSGVCQRADEPGELIAYWHRNYGKSLPVGLKRGLARAATRLYTQNAALKYDKGGVRFADVIALTHAAPKDERQNDLFTYLIGQRKGVKVELPASLKTIKTRHEITHGIIEPSASDLLRAGMTWEALSGIQQGEWTAAKWESVIPQMGYMALLRNLANFDKAKIGVDAVASVCAKLSDPDQVAMSKQFPMRFLSALKSVGSYRWSAALESALDASVGAIPEFGGKTLILVDTSGSMRVGFSKDGTLRRWDAAALFALALAARCESADVYSYSNSVKEWEPKAGWSLAKSLEMWDRRGYNLSGGTATYNSLKSTFRKHDRVVILTDEQAAAANGRCSCGAYHGGRLEVGSAIPADVPLHTFNLAGYALGHAAGGPNRYTYGGLTDAGFSMMKLVENGGSGRWPWEVTE